MDASAPPFESRVAPIRERPFSIHDARGLNPGQFGLSAGVGFPLLAIAGEYGLTNRLNLVATYNSYYGLFSQPGVGLKASLYNNKETGTAFAFQIGAAYTFFLQSEAQENQSPGNFPGPARWMTGERDASLNAQFIYSMRGPRGVPLFVSAGVEPNIDLHPVPDQPLAGPPPSYTLGFNVPLRMGVELPLGRYVNLLAMWGADIHERPSDSRAMPFILLGLSFATFGGQSG